MIILCFIMAYYKYKILQQIVIDEMTSILVNIGNLTYMQEIEAYILTKMKMNLLVTTRFTQLQT